MRANICHSVGRITSRHRWVLGRIFHDAKENDIENTNNGFIKLTLRKINVVNERNLFLYNSQTRFIHLPLKLTQPTFQVQS